MSYKKSPWYIHSFPSCLSLRQINVARANLPFRKFFFSSEKEREVAWPLDAASTNKNACKFIIQFACVLGQSRYFLQYNGVSYALTFNWGSCTRMKFSLEMQVMTCVRYHIATVWIWAPKFVHTLKIILHRVISVVWLTNFLSEIQSLIFPRWCGPVVFPERDVDYLLWQVVMDDRLSPLATGFMEFDDYLSGILFLLLTNHAIWMKL